MAQRHLNISRYWIIVCSLTLLLAVGAWFHGGFLSPNSSVRVVSVLLFGMALLLCRGLLTTTWRRAVLRLSGDKPPPPDRDPAARAGADDMRHVQDPLRWRRDLIDTLRARHGWRWRYRAPWILLSGNDATIGHHWPSLVTQGWSVSDEAVLLWLPSTSNGVAEDHWLKQIASLRRRRPVDAVALVFDVEKDIFASQRDRQSLYVRSFRIARVLRWAAPTHFIFDTCLRAAPSHDATTVGCVLPRRCTEAVALNALQCLDARLAALGTQHIASEQRDDYIAKLSRLITDRAPYLAQLCTTLEGPVRAAEILRGIWFVPAGKGTSNSTTRQSALPALLHRIAHEGHRVGGRRTGYHPRSACAWLISLSAALSISGIAFSGERNMREVQYAEALVQRSIYAEDSRAGLQALRDIQRSIERFERLAHHGLPWLSRFGLNRNGAIADKLWSVYSEQIMQRILLPVHRKIETSLTQRTVRQAAQTHRILEAYLMLAEPERAKSQSLATTLAAHWVAPVTIKGNEREDFSQSLFSFISERFASHPEWAIPGSSKLVESTRHMLRDIDRSKHSPDAIYTSILAAAKGKYPDQSLAILLAGTSIDARGFFDTKNVVPGIFTRGAYDAEIARAIDSAASRATSRSSDWVVNGTSDAPLPQASDALSSALRARYFNDYAAHWRAFGNSINWVPANNLASVSEQLGWLSDPQNSPLIALLRMFDEQSRVDQHDFSTADKLVIAAQSKLAALTSTTADTQAKPARNPTLEATFEPIRRLAESAQRPGAFSLQRYMDDIAGLRLKLEATRETSDQQDETQDLMLAQFQGKNAYITDLRNRAKLVAASLGGQWSGLADTLFVRPIHQTTMTLMGPAESRLNEAWQQGIAKPWQSAFQDRYPFASTRDEASFPELLRFIRADSGLITSFIQERLSGMLVLRNGRWVLRSGLGPRLRINAQWLDAINLLHTTATRLSASGGAQYRFDLMPRPTSGVTQTRLSIDGQKLAYFNQADKWHHFVWPGNDLLVSGAQLESQTESAALHPAFEDKGRWAFIRMLDAAQITPISDARMQLEWSTGRNGKPLSYVMRTDLGNGPISLLALKGFALPTRIFATDETRASRAVQPPPLPAAVVAAVAVAEKRSAIAPLPATSVDQKETVSEE